MFRRVENLIRGVGNYGRDEVYYREGRKDEGGIGPISSSAGWILGIGGDWGLKREGI